jgi:hypothetical protein
MRHTKLNVVALAIILVGGVHLAAPPQAFAQQQQVCCDGPNHTSCCGDECRANQNGCDACSGWWGCLFF